jgi:superfamily II DNA or RNA helicase
MTLLPHQAAAVDWLLARLRRYRGALLADPPGLGKTYVALAVAARLGGPTLVIAPAALRERWLEAMRETGVRITFVSTERLSAPSPVRPIAATCVIIDEAHHLRSASTRRYSRARELCANASVLLLSATPIHNARADLHDVLALVHAPPARLTTRQLRHALTLRRSIEDIGVCSGATVGATFRIPRVVYRHQRVAPLAAPHAMHAIEELSPLSDTVRDSAHALLQRGMLHALCSSTAAFVSRLQHRIAVLHAIEDAVTAGIDPSPLLRRAWVAADDSVQLAMPALLGSTVANRDPSLAARAAVQRAELTALRSALRDSNEHARMARLRRIARWCAEPVVAFTQFEATADACYRALRVHSGIGRLSGSGAEIASGPISRDEALNRLLSPRWSASHQRLRLLITTDVLSEGLSLAGVATVVHLDLPWTPARLDQRVGRAARIGAPVSVVRVLDCPAAVPPVLRTQHQQLLRRKRHAMQPIATRISVDPLATLTLLRALEARAPHSQPLVRGVARSSVHVRVVTHLAIVRVQGRRQLVALVGGELSAPTPTHWRALATSTPAPFSHGHVATLRRALARYAAQQRMSERVSDAKDVRFHARIAGDEALLQQRWRGSIIAANRATESRRQLDHARDQRASHTSLDSIRVYAIIVLLPGDAHELTEAEEPS